MVKDPTLGAALRYVATHPAEIFVRRWNWKNALLSVLMRAPVLFATSLLNLFFQNQTAHLWMAGGGVLVFSGMLVYDTWRLKNAYGPDDYIMAAVRIYLDVLNMFMYILTLLGGNRRSN